MAFPKPYTPAHDYERKFARFLETFTHHDYTSFIDNSGLDGTYNNSIRNYFLGRKNHFIPTTLSTVFFGIGN